ncbi:MAG: AMP-binding protein [Thermoanaerobaculia bacterium]
MVFTWRTTARSFLDSRPAAAPRTLSRAAFVAGVGRAAAFLSSVGIGPGARLLLLAENSPEWQMVALAAQLLRAEPAALFASLGADTVAGIARRVRPRVVFVSTAAQWDKLASACIFCPSGISPVTPSSPSSCRRATS